MARAPIAIAAAIFVLGQAGTAGALTAPAYRASADAVCARANASLDRLATPDTDAEVRSWINRAVPIYARGVGRLRTLAPPPALRARHARWTTVLGRRVRVARALRARIEAGAPPRTSLQAARPRLASLQRTARAEARRLRLVVCAGRGSAG